MHGCEPGEYHLHFVRVRVVGAGAIGIKRVAADGRHDFRVKQRGGRRLLLKAPVRMPAGAEIAGLLVRLAAQLVRAVRGYAELVRLSPRAQIASRLHGYSFPWGGGGAAAVPNRQEELAELTGLSRKTVNLVLRDFETQWHVERGYRRIGVLDAAGLHRIAMEGSM